MLHIRDDIVIPDTEVELTAIRAQGAGGQHVNKVSTAIHLRFNIAESSLPNGYKARLLRSHDYRISRNGLIIIKAQRFRSQEQNKADALQRLVRLIKKITAVPKKRKKTAPSQQSINNRLDNKTRHGALKRLRTVLRWVTT